MDSPAPQTVAIIDLGAGNLRSVHKAVERAATDGAIAATAIVTSNHEDVARADRIILPGVGAFGACMDALLALDGMRETLEQAVFEARKPLLGICVGMQMLADRGFEFGARPGLGWLAGEVIALDPQTRQHKVPHMGWNQVKANNLHALFGKRNELSGENFYFLHSYHFVPETKVDIIGETTYGAPLVAALAKGNIAGVQFHPEKSQGAGLALLQNFLRWQL